jgi:MscS family membrane protein
LNRCAPIVLLCVAAAWAGDPLKRDTPQSAAAAFLEACNAHDYSRAWKYLDLRKLPPDRRFKDGPGLAQQLATVLEHDGRFDAGALSPNAEGSNETVDSFNLNGRSLELQLERITLHSGTKVWLFSADSVALIPQLAKLASDTPLERHLPDPLVNWKLMDTPVWRWIALALLAAGLTALSRLVSRPALAILEQARKRVAPHMDASVPVVLLGPLRLLGVAIAFRAGMEWIGPAPALRRLLEDVVSLGFLSGVAWLAMGLVDMGSRRLSHSLLPKYHGFASSVLPLAARVVKIVIGVAALAAVLSSWGYNTTTILAGMGIGGVALALAAQKTIENLFGGVAMITDRPVAVGDFCRFGNQVGTVEDIGLRSTRIRTLDRTLLTVPNGEFSTMTLENFSKRDKMWFHLTLNLRRNTSPEQVRELLGSITASLKKHPKVEMGPLPVRFIGVGTYSLDLEIFVYVLTPVYDEFLQIQQELLLWILDAVEAAGTALALPTQATYITGPAANAIPTRPLPVESDHQQPQTQELASKSR